MQSNVILSTKVAHPQLRKDVVSRGRLLEKISAERMNGIKLLLVAAPAGFGKSTLVLDWLSHVEHRSAWLSVDDLDNDLRQFFISLVSAVQSIHPGTGRQILPLVRGASTPALEHLAALLINDLHRLDEELIVVLDDYQHITEPNVHFAISYILDHLPRNVHLVITTRVDPMLQLPRLRVRNELIEIRERDLRFTVEESSRFLTGTMGCTLGRNDIQALAQRTEGWIAGLQIAAISLRGRTDGREFIESFTGTNRYIVDYLLEEVVNHQPEHIRLFLIETSILSQFNSDLCNAVTGRVDAAQIIGTLEKANVFITPLDERREWYRYHQLFSESLQHRGHQHGTAANDLAHERASRWYESHGELSRALEHALSRSTSELALELLDAHGFDLFQRSELSTLEQYLRRVPAHMHRCYPKLLIAKAWVLLMTHQGKSLDQTLSEATTSVEHPPPHYTAEDIDIVRGNLQVIRAFALRLLGELDESMSVSEQCLAALPPDQHILRSIVRFNMGRVQMKRGWPRKAIECFEQCMSESPAAQNPYVALGTQAHMGSQVAVLHGLDAAQRVLEEALSNAEQDGLTELPACGFILYHLGRVLYHRNEVQRAIEVLGRAIALGERGHEPDILHNALTMSALAYWASDDNHRASECIKQASLIDSQDSIQVYEASPAQNRAFLAMVIGDENAVVDWIEQSGNLPQREFSTVVEFEAVSFMYACGRQGLYEKIPSVAQWLRAEATLRERTSTIGHADLYEALALFELKEYRKAYRLFERALEFGARHGWVRVFLSNGKPMQELLKSYSGQHHEPSPGYSFALHLLQLMEGGSLPSTPGFPHSATEQLTDREQEVLMHICHGLSNEEISNTLFISSNTLKTHIRRLYAKLGVTTRSDAIAKAGGLSQRP